jgi:serine/threonine protein kinase
MEVAEVDLSEFMKRENIEIPQKIGICNDLLNCLIGLHSISIFHRDIKPDNIMRVDGAWKFIDLGIADLNGRNLAQDDVRERIGPFGYMSPEALNKCMGVKTHEMFKGSCRIDAKSDVFQLGMLYWFILTGEVPAGIILSEDLVELGLDESFFHNGIGRMLQLRKKRRPSCAELKISMSDTFATYGLS